LSLGIWLYVHLVIPCFHLPFDVFSSALWIKLGLPNPLAFNLTHCIFYQLLDSMGIHLLYCAHGGEKTTSHDVIQNTFASVVKDVGFQKDKT
jgi:hypothetical protein